MNWDKYVMNWNKHDDWLLYLLEDGKEIKRVGNRLHYMDGRLLTPQLIKSLHKFRRHKIVKHVKNRVTLIDGYKDLIPH